LIFFAGRLQKHIEIFCFTLAYNLRAKTLMIKITLINKSDLNNVKYLLIKYTLRKFTFNLSKFKI